MASYEPKITAVLGVDLYNDFLGAGGKLFPWSMTAQQWQPPARARAQPGFAISNLASLS